MSETTLPWDAGMNSVMRDLSIRVSSLQSSMPTNSDSLPLSYINPAIILETGVLQDSISNEDADASVVNISYLEGFPTVEGLPFWERLEGEVLDYYNTFKHYRNMKDSKGTRSLAATAEAAGAPISQIHILAQIYHWTARCKAYDMYKSGEIQAERNRFVRLMENKHMTAAQTMFTDCVTYLKDNLKALKPVDAVKLLEMAVKLERLSLGLDPEKPYFKGQDTSADGRTIIQNYQIQAPQPGVSQNDNTTSQLQEVISILSASGALDASLIGKPNRSGASDRKVVELLREQDHGRS